MTLRVWPDADFDTGDTGFWQWLRDWAADFIGHKAQSHPQRFVELLDVDETGLADGSVFIYDAASSTFKPALSITPAVHGASHAAGGTDPIPGGSTGSSLVFD